MIKELLFFQKMVYTTNKRIYGKEEKI